MNDTEFERRLREAVRGQPVPPPSEEQMQAILSRRLARDRVGLPHDAAPAGNGLRRWAVVLTLGAAASVLAVAWPQGPRSAADPLGAAGLTGVDPLYAQATDRPTFPLIRPARPLVPGVWHYGMAWPWTGPIDSTESWTQQLVIGSYEGAPAYGYRYGKDRNGGAGLTDTLWLNRETLRPLSREAANATGGHVTQIFKANSILTGFRTPGGMTTWHSADLDSLGPVVKGLGRLPADLYESQGPVALWRPQIAASLGAAELGPGWRGSMEVLVSPLTVYALRFWLNFEVVGEERVALPAGNFEAWKIQVGKRPGFSAWVSKKEQWLLQLGSENTPRGSRQVLLSAETAPSR